jgi:hypothetical protein
LGICAHEPSHSPFDLSRNYGGKTDQAALQDHLGKLNAKLDVYDRILAKQKYLAGDVCGSHLFAAKSLFLQSQLTL